MGERWGRCPACKGHGQINVFVQWLGVSVLEMCGGCEGTGFWGGAFPPEEKKQYESPR